MGHEPLLSTSKAVAPKPDEISIKDERNKAIRGLASRNGYIALTAGVLLMSAHELARSGRVGILIIPVAFSLVSILFLIFRLVQLRLQYQLDEWGRQLMLKSFAYAVILVLIGNIVYLSYFSLDPNRSSTALLVCILPQPFAIAAVEATLIFKNAPTSYSLLTYWVSASTVLMLATTLPFIELLERGLLPFLVNPGWLFTIATIYVSVLVARHDLNKQKQAVHL